MKRAEKAKAFHKAMNEFNRAKAEMHTAAMILEEQGLYKDAETLMNMVYRLEMFQTKYDEYRL